jgi:hypothetical protein
MPDPLSNIANIATIIESIAVVASVLFIAYQLRQSTQLAKVANTQALVEISSPFNLQLIQDRRMAEFWVRGSQDYEQMDTVDQYRYKSMLIWWLILQENVYYQSKEKLLDHLVYSAWDRDLRTFVHKQHLSKFWPELKSDFHMEFGAYVDRLVEEEQKQTSAKP